MPFNIPRPFKTTLDNGLRIILFEDKRVPLVSYRLAFLCGDIHDPADAIGITSAMASMLTEGTQNYTSLALAEKIERIGASLSANASADFTAISASALSLYRDEVLHLIAEIIFHPTFPESELDLYRRNTIEHLKFQRSQPGFLANEQAARLVYGPHPYSRVSPGADDIQRLDRGALQKFHEQTLVPNNALLIAIGDLDREEFLKQVNDEFGGWQRRELDSSGLVQIPKRSKRILTIVDRPGSAQANIVLANTALRRRDPDYFPVSVMNQILGAGASSRVFMNLREEKGYTYGAYTRFDMKIFAGDFEATAEVRTAVTGDSLKEFFYELDRIHNEKATEEELDDAKNFLTGVFPIRAETQEGLTGLVVNQELYDLSDDYLQSYRDNINAVTLDDVLAAAKKYVRPDEAAIVIVGDAAEVLPQARKFADDVEIFDTEGRPLDIASFEHRPDEANANVSGTWELALDFLGQLIPVTMQLEQNDESISGSIETMLGSGTINEGQILGSKLKASSNVEIQGQMVELAISGAVTNDSITGSISAPIVPSPLPFTGKKITDKDVI